MEHFCHRNLIVKYDTVACKSKLQYCELALKFSYICNCEVLLSVTSAEIFCSYKCCFNGFEAEKYYRTDFHYLSYENIEIVSVL